MGDRVGAVARRVGSGGTLAAYAVAVVALLALIRLADGHSVAVAIGLSVGALHLLYGGFIWRSRQPGGDSTMIGPLASAGLLRPVAVIDPNRHRIGR